MLTKILSTIIFKLKHRSFIATKAMNSVKRTVFFRKKLIIKFEHRYQKILSAPERAVHKQTNVVLRLRCSVCARFVKRGRVAAPKDHRKSYQLQDAACMYCIITTRTALVCLCSEVELERLTNFTAQSLVGFSTFPTLLKTSSLLSKLSCSLSPHLK